MPKPAPKKTPKRTTKKPASLPAPISPAPLITEIKAWIDSARQRAAVAVNAELTLLHWRIGQRISTEVTKGKRAEYGKQILAEVSRQLTQTYGAGWGESQLRFCLRMAEVFPDPKILHTLCAELSWSHFRLLASVDDALKRGFYTEMCRVEHWSVRQLQERMKSMLYERTAISKKPKKTILGDLAALRKDGRVSADLAFRDPYVLDFLGLKDSYSEQDLESAIVEEIQRFIGELGNDFAFLARQKRITIDKRDYKIDLLFYHRRLRCLVAIDLKVGEFEAGYKGQMELYLRYLEKHEQMPGENSPIGLILCAGKNEEHVELLQLGRSNIRVAEYMTALPPRAVLEAKLHQSIELARQRLDAKA